MNSATTGQRNPAPPDYDTLSLAPPGIDEAPSSSSSNSQLRQSRNVDGNADSLESSQSGKKSMKQKWKEMKEEDERRRAERYTYVTPEEADRITGLDKHKESEAKKSAERKRGGKSVLGILMLS